MLVGVFFAGKITGFVNLYDNVGGGGSATSTSNAGVSYSGSFVQAVAPPCDSGWNELYSSEAGVTKCCPSGTSLFLDSDVLVCAEPSSFSADCTVGQCACDVYSEVPLPSSFCNNIVIAARTETKNYYSTSLSPLTSLSFDKQYVVDPLIFRFVSMNFQLTRPDFGGDIVASNMDTSSLYKLLFTDSNNFYFCSSGSPCT